MSKPKVSNVQIEGARTMNDEDKRLRFCALPLERRVGRHFIQHIISPDKLVAGKWTYTTEDRDVVLMAVVGIYAMVRRKGCVPYVCDVKELSLIPTVAEMRKLLTPNVKVSGCAPNESEKE